ncbi:branched-chain amino acid ABC transporter permease [Frisingicoccus sp.]|uniref:branched-chain amino acid ABC transporter permease n=1 Tax=Frisingicoccus sp. TaxID=1918627 RepID=UPI003AB7E356
MNKKIDKKMIINVVAAVAAYIVVMILINGGILGRQAMSIIIPCCINVILAVSLCLLVGFLGELTLGHAGFMSIGAYAGALTTNALNFPPMIELIIGLLVGGIFAAIFSLIIGLPVLRLKGDYLAIVTLGFGEIIKSVINALGFTGGAKGLTGIGAYSNYKNFTFVYIFVLLTILVISNLVRSRHGRAICAVRDNAIAAEAIGIKVTKFKTMAFVISGFFAGMAGVFYAHNVGILKPVNFDYNKSIEILVMVVLGGMGNIKGAVIAAVILTALPEVLRGAADFRMLLYAIVLIAMMLFNNSRFRMAIIEKRNLKKAMSIQKEGE